MINHPIQELDLASEYETSIETTYRLLNLTWMLVSFYVAISLVYLSGADYREVIFFALGAPAAFFATSWINHRVLSQYRLIPVIGYCAWLPVLVQDKATSPWISIGLIMVTAALSAVSFRSVIASMIYTAVCALLQIYIATLEIIGVSDTTDTLLLDGFFSTLWVLISGFASVFVLRNYLSYAKKLDEVFAKITQEYWERSQRIAKINLKDYLNLKLHGTVLNTLIVAQQMPEVASPQAISAQLKAELEDLETHESDVFSVGSIRELVFQQINFGRLATKIKYQETLALDKNELNIVLEFIREVTLNINRHTNSEEIVVTIGGDDQGKTLVTVQEILKDVVAAKDLESRVAAALNSSSMTRLCVDSGANYSVKSYPDGQLLHVVHIDLHENDLDLLGRFKKYRSESLSIFVRNLSLIPTSFALFSIPAFLFQGVPDFVVLVLSLTVITHLFILVKGASSPMLNGALAFFPLSIFPYTYWTLEGCSELYALPWILNAALGALLFGAYTTTATVSRWLPGILMILGCSLAILLLPNECKSLLNGTTPGIVIVLVIARYLMILRNRNFKLDAELDAFIRNQSRADEIILNRISKARSGVISNVNEFLNRHSDKGSSSYDISRLINLIRCYLLCSEKIDDDFISDFFDWIIDRYDKGLDTSLEIYRYDNSNLPPNFEFRDISSLIDEVYGNSKIHLIIDSSEPISIEILSAERVEKEVAMLTNKFLPNVQLKFSRL